MSNLFKENDNTVVIAEGCTSDACSEPSKRQTGHGLIADKSNLRSDNHLNTYRCNKFAECRGKCGCY